MPIRHRRGRRNDDLYQARIHQRIDEQAEQPLLTFEELYKRAQIARGHKARHTFVAPETLMHLIKVNEHFLKLKRLVDGHWERAKKEQDGGYSERDLFLWTQGLGWNERDDE